MLKPASLSQRASYLATASRHSGGGWLLALPLASCGLKLEDEAVRVAVDLRPGLNVCVPRQCQYGAQTYVRRIHSFSHFCL